MKKIAVLSQKGGAGKTTLSLNLAVAAAEQGESVLVVDIDPQSSAAQWGQHRDLDMPLIISAQAAMLGQVLQTAEDNEATLVIIDTAPHSDNAALTAARAADLVLIPCRPSVLDLRAISQSNDIATLSNTRSFVVLNAVPPRGGLGDEAREVIEANGIAVAPTSIAQRAAFMHSLTEGKVAQEYEPAGKAAAEVQALYTWLVNMLTL